MLFDTHFAHRDEDDAARTRSAQLLLAKVTAIAGRLPVIVTGDLNARPESDAYRTIAARLGDAWARATTRQGPALTFHDFTGMPDRRIDYVFVRGFRAVTARVVTDARAGRYPSDHFPVMAVLR